nr:element excision factor XisH family protein [Trichocoleus sp. FACHB-40]
MLLIFSKFIECDRTRRTRGASLDDTSDSDMRSRLGQFLNYRLALQMSEPDRTLYLAVPFDTFDSFFQERFVQEAVRLYQLKLVVYDPQEEVVIEWRN